MTSDSRHRSGNAPVLQPAHRQIAPQVALAAFATAWIAGQVIAAAILTTAGRDQSDAPIVLVLASVVLAWGCYLVVMVFVSQRYGAGRFRADFGFRVRSRDVAGIGIGVLCQVVLVPVVYLPLERLWPTTFSDDRVQENATGLATRASGITTLLLVLVVAVGAPIVEELVYRGLIQRSLMSRLSDAVAVTVTAALFTLIHFRPVEYPGLFVFAIVLGVCAATTRRLGLAIFVHVGFNATGLLLVMS